MCSVNLSPEAEQENKMDLQNVTLHPDGPDDIRQEKHNNWQGQPNKVLAGEGEVRLTQGMGD